MVLLGPWACRASEICAATMFGRCFRIHSGKTTLGATTPRPVMTTLRMTLLPPAAAPVGVVARGIDGEAVSFVLEPESPARFSKLVARGPVGAPRAGGQTSGPEKLVCGRTAPHGHLELPRLTKLLKATKRPRLNQWDTLGKFGL